MNSVQAVTQFGREALFGPGASVSQHGTIWTSDSQSVGVGGKVYQSVAQTRSQFQQIGKISAPVNGQLSGYSILPPRLIYSLILGADSKTYSKSLLQVHAFSHQNVTIILIIWEDS